MNLPELPNNLAIGGKMLSIEQIRFAIWLATPKDQRIPGTQRELALELLVHENTLTGWKSMPGFANAVINITLDIVKGKIPKILWRMVEDSLDNRQAPGVVTHARDRILELSGVWSKKAVIDHNHKFVLENALNAIED